MAVLLETVELAVGQSYWTHLDDSHKNHSYDKDAHRHNFQPGAITRIESERVVDGTTETGVWVQRQPDPGGNAPVPSDAEPVFLWVSYAPYFVWTPERTACVLCLFGSNTRLLWSCGTEPNLVIMSWCRDITGRLI